MDPNTARHLLHLDPVQPLTAEAVETAFQREAWARHPSRYPDGDDRRSAEAWAATLAEARASLRAVSGTTAEQWPMADVSQVDGPAASVGGTGGRPAPRRGLSRGAIIGIVAGATALVLLVVGVSVGVAMLVPRFTEFLAAEQQGDPEAPPSEYVPSSELFFTFPASIEWYGDGRHLDQCPPEAANGCWDVAVIPEQDCAAMIVELGFSGTSEMPRSTYEEREFDDVSAGDRVVLVFWNDDSESAWIHDVICVEPGR